MVVFPTTERGWHEWWLRLDRKFDTQPNSPLHHDNRCTYCSKIK